MHILYVDESGDPGKDKHSSPHFILSGLIISQEDWDARHTTYPFNTPVSYEAFYYRSLFERHYPNREQLITKFWLPKLNGVESNNPSATSLDGHRIDTDF